MKLPQITEPVHLVIGDTTVEVGRLVVEHHIGGDLADRGANPNASVIALRGRLEFDAEFVSFVDSHRPAAPAPTPVTREG